MAMTMGVFTSSRSVGENLPTLQQLTGLGVTNRDAKTVRRRGGQFLEEIRKCLLHATWIVDFYGSDFQSQNGETHRHPMVVVGFNGSTMQWPGVNFERITNFNHLRAALCQFRAQ